MIGKPVALQVGYFVIFQTLWGGLKLENLKKYNKPDMPFFYSSTENIQYSIETMMIFNNVTKINFKSLEKDLIGAIAVAIQVPTAFITCKVKDDGLATRTKMSTTNEEVVVSVLSTIKEDSYRIHTLIISEKFKRDINKTIANFDALKTAGVALETINFANNRKKIGNYIFFSLRSIYLLI